MLVQYKQVKRNLECKEKKLGKRVRIGNEAEFSSAFQRWLNNNKREKKKKTKELIGWTFELIMHRDLSKDSKSY